MSLLLDQFDFSLPASLIAQHPLPKRSNSRLLYLSNKDAAIKHLNFSNLPELLLPNDLLIFNNTRVIKARLFGEKITGGKVEILIERVTNNYKALAQVRANKKIKIGMEVLLTHTCNIGTNANKNANSEINNPDSSNVIAQNITDTVIVKVIAKHNDFFVVQLQPRTHVHAHPHTAIAALATTTPNIWDVLQQYGHIPLPPYIERLDNALDEERYQSIFAQRDGAVAAPTASLHFDEMLIQQIKTKNKNIDIAFITLHVGAGTFQPVRVQSVEQHQMHAEYMEITPETCAKIKATKELGGRIIAVGTTCVRCLETATQKAGQDQIIKPFQGDTNIFIYPGFKFRVVDALITNFHLPKSTLLMLVCAFGGYENVMRAYTEAVKLQYRFFSYGDAMLLTRSN